MHLAAVAAVAVEALAAAMLALLLPALPAAAEPYTPGSDEELVERLPSRSGSAAERARLRAEQQQLLLQAPRAASPQPGVPSASGTPGQTSLGPRGQPDLALALRAAREAIDRSRRYGDARELGSAQAWLRPWWDAPAAPAPARLLKAIVLQARHEFDAALAELDTLLAAPATDPAVRAQAELTRASLHQLRGRWDEARAGCQRLAAPPLRLVHGEVCLAELDGLQGRGPAALQRLAALERSAPPALQGWITLIRAEMAEREGSRQAGPLFQRALQVDGELYARAAYADWLLRAGRPGDALALLRPAAADPRLDSLPDALLLRLAIAARQARDTPAATAAAAEMRRRFEAAAQRGDASHARERARFALDVEDDAAQALAQATLNWRQQKEPADALLLLRAARAAQQPQAADTVRAFLRERSVRDVRLQGL